MEKEATLRTVELTRRIRDAQHEQLKDKTWEERVAFYKEQARALHEALRRTLQRQPKQEEEAA
jgi:hypothetical protein